MEAMEKAGNLPGTSKYELNNKPTLFDVNLRKVKNEQYHIPYKNKKRICRRYY
jgi:hypothetical protein